MAKPRAQLALRVTTPDGYEITALVSVRAKRLPKFLGPLSTDVETPGESAPESTRPVLRVLDGGKR